MSGEQFGAGKRLGDRYVLGNEIGRGGMATVYSATDSLLEREVAVKVLTDQGPPNNDFVERFRREAKSAASLDHPNIVATHDYGEQDDAHYIVMEKFESKALGDILASSGPLDPDVAVQIAIGAASGLAAAHAKGIVHRDVKPNNILVGRNGIAKISDFGIARKFEVNSTTITQVGQVPGTATYASPEQARGGEVDQRSDLYSLGVVIYQMLAANPSFQADTPISMALKHAQESAPDLKSVSANVPEALASLVAKLLEKDSSNRVQTSEELVGILKKIAAGESPAELKVASPSSQDMNSTRVDNALPTAQTGQPLLDVNATAINSAPMPSAPNRQAQPVNGHHPAPYVAPAAGAVAPPPPAVQAPSPVLASAPPAVPYGQAYEAPPAPPYDAAAYVDSGRSTGIWIAAAAVFLIFSVIGIGGYLALSGIGPGDEAASGDTEIAAVVTTAKKSDAAASESNPIVTLSGLLEAGTDEAMTSPNAPTGSGSTLPPGVNQTIPGQVTPSSGAVSQPGPNVTVAPTTPPSGVVTTSKPPATAAPTVAPTTAPAPTRPPATVAPTTSPPATPAPTAAPRPRVIVANEAEFRMPSNNVVCSMSQIEVDCYITSKNWVPSDFGYSVGCSINSGGNYVRLQSGSSLGEFPCDPPTALAPARPPILDYGDGYRVAGTTCMSETTGVLCTNNVGAQIRLARSANPLVQHAG